jgi:hypothetical protein
MRSSLPTGDGGQGQRATFTATTQSKTASHFAAGGLLCYHSAARPPIPVWSCPRCAKAVGHFIILPALLLGQTVSDSCPLWLDASSPDGCPGVCAHSVSRAHSLLTIYALCGILKWQQAERLAAPYSPRHGQGDDDAHSTHGVVHLPVRRQARRDRLLHAADPHRTYIYPRQGLL